MRGRRALHVGIGLLFAAAVFLTITGVLLGSLAYDYRDRFYPGVRVGGIELSKMTQSEGKQAVDARIKKYLAHPVSVILPDTSKPDPQSPNSYQSLQISTTAGKLGLAFDSDSAMATAWSVGHGAAAFKWLKDAPSFLFNGSSQPLSYHIDQTAVDTFIKTSVLPRIGAPVAAAISVQGKTVSIVPPKAGFQVDQTELARQLAASLETATDDDTTYLKAPVKQVESDITQQTVRPLADRLDQAGNLKLSLKTDGFSAAPKREDILGWIQPVQDDKGALSLVIKKDAVSAYLAGFSQLDQSKSADALADKLDAVVASADPLPAVLSVSVTAKPKPAASSATADPSDSTPGKFPGKYIEVNLAKQRMFLFDGTTLLNTYVVSSGKWSTPTPPGTYSIHDKSPRAWSAEFGLYMPYWMDFKDGAYGIHALPVWPNGYVEGENHLGIPVSHGCVRLGSAAAAYVYNWTDVGTPVYIH